MVSYPNSRLMQAGVIQVEKAIAGRGGCANRRDVKTISGAKSEHHSRTAAWSSGVPPMSSYGPSKCLTRRARPNRATVVGAKLRAKSGILYVLLILMRPVWERRLDKDCPTPKWTMVETSTVTRFYARFSHDRPGFILVQTQSPPSNSAEPRPRMVINVQEMFCPWWWGMVKIDSRINVEA